MNSQSAGEGVNHTSIELAVLKYLRKKGYKSAEEAFRAESRVYATNEQMTMMNYSTLDTDASLTNQILLFNQEELNPRRYIDTYKKLREWVDTSLDLYKNELSGVLYPVFIHCYLDLIEKNCVDLAREFLDNYLPDHERLHGAEVKKLSGLGAPEHLKGNEQ
eukprot:967909-Pyramimonas_sp.AAC.3